MCRSSFLSLLLIVTCGSFAQAQTYFYDDAGRILRVAYPQGNGVQYSYDESDNLVQVRRLTLPAAPSGLTAVRLASDSVQLAWTDSSSNEGGFVIMRKLVGDRLRHGFPVGLYQRDQSGGQHSAHSDCGRRQCSLG
jgi:YD repeat-containing protein